MVGVNTSYSTRCLLPCYSSLRGWVYDATEGYSKSRFLARLVGTHVSLKVIQILIVLILVEFLRWEFKLLSTSLRSTRNSSGLNWVVIVLLGLPSSPVCSCGKWSFSLVENLSQTA